jgi:Rieske Fe-S protein
MAFSSGESANPRGTGLLSSRDHRRSCSNYTRCQAAKNEGRSTTYSKTSARASFRRLQTIIGVSFLLSSFSGAYLLATDGSLWHLAISHAYGLIAVVSIDGVLGLLNLLSKRSVYVPSLAAGVLGFLLQLGDIATAPQYHMTVTYFASYLFGLWAFDLLLALQLTVLIAGVIGSRYAAYLAKVKKRNGRELVYTRRRFITSLFGFSVVIAGAVLAASVKLPDPNTTATQTSQTTQTTQAGGAIANANQLKVGSPVYFEYPSGYPNLLLKKSDGTLVALSMLCTHACCECTYESSSNLIYCPCHGSIFDTTGKVLRGPAGTPLPSIQLAVDAGGRIYPKGISGSGPCTP